jgi:hypothetical protein
MTDKKQPGRVRDEVLRREEEERIRAEAARLAAHERQLFAHERPPDVADPRAKSTGHGKKTADKWTQ